jgi:hypothetical protein
MSANNTQQVNQENAGHDDEIVDSALDAVSGGQSSQPIQKLETMVVTAKRLPANESVVQKMDTMVVTATRLPPDTGGSQLAQNTATPKKGA